MKTPKLVIQFQNEIDKIVKVDLGRPSYVILKGFWSVFPMHNEEMRIVVNPNRDKIEITFLKEGYKIQFDNSNRFSGGD